MLYKVARRAWSHRPAWLRRPLEGTTALPPMDRWLERRREEYTEFVVEGDTTVWNLFGDTYEADMSLTPDSATAVYKRRLMDGVIGRIAESAERSGVPLLFVIVPSPVDLCPGWSGVTPDPGRFPAYRPEALTDALGEIVAGRDLHHVNLFEPIRDAGACELYFRAGNDHWNDAGQALAAEQVGRYVLERQLLTGPKGSGESF